MINRERERENSTTIESVFSACHSNPTIWHPLRPDLTRNSFVRLFGGPTFYKYTPPKQGPRQKPNARGESTQTLPFPLSPKNPTQPNPRQRQERESFERIGFVACDVKHLFLFLLISIQRKAKKGKKKKKRISNKPLQIISEFLFRFFFLSLCLYM